MLRLLLITFILLGGHLHLQAQGYLRTQGTAIVNEQGDTVILRGMGLGGWMVQEGYMLQTAAFANPQHKIREKIEELIGPADTEAFYDGWLANHCREADVDSLKSWGFNSIRLPMHYNLYTLPIEDEPVAGQQTWLSKGFDMTDSLIAWCKKRDMYVVLDMHATPGGQGYDQGISDYDPTKPSLWESELNKQKLIALWTRLARRYADEPWVAGYDLINEPNWDLPGGVALRELYGRLTDSIRAVDGKHIIFIEGNWFANDFTGLTPPWDPNMVYSPHKYWSLNDEGSMNFATRLRDQYNIPLYLGETGENSNVWFRDAVRLFEGLGIGWAWWPLKKIDAIAGPLSITKTNDYQSLLNYWQNGGAKPSQEFARNTLMELTENLKIENCRYQPDVTDALFRQVYADTAIPFRTQQIPGVVYATDYDLGSNHVAYFDTEVATYHLSTTNFTAWNRGYTYRNDGVDMERCEDNVNTNGYNVGWLNQGEWMQYDVVVAKEAVYDIELRMANGGFEGAFHFEANGNPISGRKAVPHTGDYQSWETVTLTDVVLTPAINKLRFYADGDNFNVSSFHFVEKGATTSLETKYLWARTKDPQTIALTLNKPITGPLSNVADLFEIKVAGNEKAISSVALDPKNPQVIQLSLSYVIQPEEEIRIEYDGTTINATDGTALETFSRRFVENTVPYVHILPTKIEAEQYFFQYGTAQATAFDNGRGTMVSDMGEGEYLDYYIEVPTQGRYEITFRTAAATETGEFKIERVDDKGIAHILETATFNPTGDGQNWSDTKVDLFLPVGRHHLRLEISQSDFNFNWMEFALLVSNQPKAPKQQVSLYPNPTQGLFTLSGSFEAAQALELRVFDQMGRQVLTETFAASASFTRQLDLSREPIGTYVLLLRMADGQVVTKRVIKQ